MAASIRLRDDYTGDDLRAMASKSVGFWRFP